jgi:predicted DNA-binding protein
MDINEALIREAQEEIVLNNLKEDLAIAESNLERLHNGLWAGDTKKDLKRRIKALKVIVDFYS